MQTTKVGPGDYYQWHYVWSEDNSLVMQSFQKFRNESECRRDGEKHHPSYTSFDGPNAPAAILRVTAHASGGKPDAMPTFYKVYRGDRKLLEIWQLAVRYDWKKQVIGWICMSEMLLVWARAWG